MSPGRAPADIPNWLGSLLVYPRLTLAVDDPVPQSAEPTPWTIGLQGRVGWSLSQMQNAGGTVAVVLQTALPQNMVL